MALQDCGDGDQKLAAMHIPKGFTAAHSLQGDGDGTSNQDVMTQGSQPQTDSGGDGLGAWMAGILGGGTPFSTA